MSYLWERLGRLPYCVHIYPSTEAPGNINLGIITKYYAKAY